MRIDKWLKTLGPGILFASTAIGVSHLVQSTRAGAVYGFALLWAVIAANVLKFPFFEFGSRYANAAGESLIDGYRKLGRYVLPGYLLVLLCSMFFVAAAVNAVSAGFFDNLFGIGKMFPDAPLFPVALLLALCTAILLLGQFKTLDQLIKLVGTVMIITTVFAFFLTLRNGPIQSMPEFNAPDPGSEAGIAFLIALMGWMPTAVDMSAWNSLWTIERIKTSGHRPSLRATLAEFSAGYWISALLAICFLTMGAYLVYGTGTEMPASAVAFSQKVVALYTTSIGDWSGWIISAAAFSIMFGTSIGVLDGYARAMERTVEIIFKGSHRIQSVQSKRRVYQATLIILSTGAFFIIAQFSGKLKGLVDLATTISFLIAPVIAVFNFRLVTRFDFPPEARPGFFMRLLSYAGIVFLTGFSLYFIWLKV
jgi:Mn2+/Fe2+ NRAMP family transporter